MATLQTHRIVLRTPQPSDDAPLVAIYTDPETMRHLPTLHNQPWDVARMAARREARDFEERHGRARGFTVLLTQDRTLIGQAGFRSLTPTRGEMGLILTQAQQGRGLAWDVHLLLLTLGFETLGLEVVDWVTSKGNQGMRAVLRKMGCREVEGDEGEEGEEGEDAVWRKDGVKYCLCREDWDECKRTLCEKVERYSAGSRTIAR